MRNKPAFPDRSLFPWLARLERGIPVVRDEILRTAQMPLVASGDSEHPTWFPGRPNASPEPLAWRNYVLLFLGIRHDEHIEAHPKTWELFSCVPGLFSLQISVMDAHTAIAAHKGRMAMAFRAHLPIDVPLGERCGIQVGGETRIHQQREALVFDDRHEHSAWNMSDEPRTVLIWDFMDPRKAIPAAELCRLILMSTDDPALMERGSRDEWLQWLDAGRFPSRGSLGGRNDAP